MFDPVELVRTGNRYTDQFLAAAERLGLATEIISPSTSTALIYGKGRRLTIRAAILGCNNMVATRVSSNKFLTNTRLRRAGFRVPDFRLFCTDDYPGAGAMLSAVEEFAGPRFPVVVKPVKGHGGVNVHAGIENTEDLSWVIDTLWSISPGELLVEKHVHGRHYRIKIMDDTITDLILRHPASVVGDGRSSIEELVERKNRSRRQSHIPAIPFTERTTRLLARSGLEADSVLPAGREQPLSAECNQSLGGEAERLPLEIIPDAAARYLLQAVCATGLRWVGIDYIVDDIESPRSWETGYINETNSAVAPNEYFSGCTMDEYLSQASIVLRRYFSIQ